MEQTPSAPSSCAQRSIGTWSFHLRTRHWRLTNSLRMSTSHFMKEVSWTPLASLPVKLGWKNTFTQRKRSAPSMMMFPSGEHRSLLLVNFRSRFELCVIVQACVAQFLFDIPSNLLLSGGGERESSLSEVLHEILCEVTASQTKDGVMWSKTAVDGHCVQHIVYQNPSHLPSCVLERTKTKVWIASSRGKQQSAIAIKVGAVDLEGRPQGRHATKGATQM